MGQKVNPHGARVGVIKGWSTRWYADKKQFADFLIEDYQIRTTLKEKLNAAGISRIDIERAAGKITINIFTARPGIVIGRGGAGVEAIRKDMEKMTGKPISLNVVEIRNADMDAQLVAENVAAQLGRRISFRRALKQAIGRTMKAGAKGIKAQVSGRLGGAEIARSEGYHEGSIPLQTLRADIDYGFAEAHTTYGRIGVKIWIYKGEVLPAKKDQRAAGQERGVR
ncbi:MAG: 30S ribosomal protein S3 [Christensenellales bacterium]|jgi:small subunit ribosomal protein S3